MERKNLSLGEFEIKFDEARKGFFSGYASKFGNVDSYGDTIAPGAYAKTVGERERPIAMRWNHTGPVIGKWLKAQEDEHGLYVEGELTPGHSVASDVYALMKHGAVTGLSIGYRIPEGGAEKRDGVRLLKQIELVEISVVEAPADLHAQIADVKSAIEQIDSLKEAEELLRTQGFTRSEACALVSRIKAMAHGEREAETKTAEIAGLFQHFQIPQIKEIKP